MSHACADASSYAAATTGSTRRRRVLSCITACVFSKGLSLFLAASVRNVPNLISSRVSINESQTLPSGHAHDRWVREYSVGANVTYDNCALDVFSLGMRSMATNQGSDAHCLDSFLSSKENYVLSKKGKEIKVKAQFTISSGPGITRILMVRLFGLYSRR